MTFSRALTSEQEAELIEDWNDGKWTVNDLSVIYRISHRTVYRILAKYGAKRHNKMSRKPRAKRKTSDRQLKPCGTEAAYRRHKRKKEYPCTPCLEAHAQQTAAYRNNTKN